MTVRDSDAVEQLKSIDFGALSLRRVPELIDAARDAGAQVIPVLFHGGPAMLVVGADAVEQGFLNDAELAGQNFYVHETLPWFGRVVSSMKGEEHKQHRQLFGAELMPAKLREKVMSVLRPVGNRLIDSFGADRELDFVPRFAQLYPFRVITTLLGLPLEDEPMLLEHVQNLFRYPWKPEIAARSRKLMIEYLRPIVEERKARPVDDLISAMAHAESHGKRYTDEELLDAVRFMWPVAGDNTSHGVASIIHRVLENEDVHARVLANSADRAAAVDEALRLDPPVLVNIRRTSEPMLLGGVGIPNETYVLLAVSAYNRDPKRHENPTRFSLDRGAPDSLAFGRGAHFCLGAHVARAELRVTLDLMLDRLPGLRLANKSIAMEGALQYGPTSLRIAFDDILPSV
jgi:cytochrome P450